MLAVLIMALVPSFCGGMYQTLSPVQASDTAVNLYTETREVPGSPKQVTMYGTPGLRPWVTIAGADEGRGWFSQDGRTWVVVEETLYDVNVEARTLTSLGTILDDGYPVSYASNGRGGEQLGIVGGGELKVLDLQSNVLSSAIALPFTGPVMIVFMDGYGLINEANSPIIWFSAIEDLTSWDALDFFTRSNTSDNIVGLAVTRDRLWGFGSKTSTQFYDAGDVDNPFLPYPGTTMQIGLVSPWALLTYQDVCYWIGQSATGESRAWRASDPTATAISTPPIELFLSQCRTLSSAEGLVYEQAGHPFVLWTFPDSQTFIQTYGFDVKESLWHARAGWNRTTGQYTRWRARGTVTVGNSVFVGDYDTGALYTLDLLYYRDRCGDILRRERTAPYLSAENQWIFLDQIELGMQAGVGLTGPEVPCIESVTPGSAAVGDEVTITGSQFGATQGASSVTIDGITAVVVSWSDTSIVVTVPPGVNEGVTIVIVDGQTSDTSNPIVLDITTQQCECFTATLILTQAQFIAAQLEQDDRIDRVTHTYRLAR